MPHAWRIDKDEHPRYYPSAPEAILKTPIPILLVGDQREVAAVTRSLREAFAGSPTHQPAVDSTRNAVDATTAVDTGEFPHFIVFLPMIATDDAVEFLRHVRGCGRSTPVLIWKYRTPDADTIATVRHHSGIVVADDNPIRVVNMIVSIHVGTQFAGRRATKGFAAHS